MKEICKELVFYLIFLCGVAASFGVLFAFEQYVTGTSLILIVLAPFIILAVFISAIIEGNPHSGGPEWVFYTIIGVQVLIVLTVVWFLIRLVYKSIRNKPVKALKSEK